MADNQASNIPPFIPGLLIVSLLIIISVLIGWRNYMRRGSSQAPVVLAEWNLNWLQDGGGQAVTNPIQRPKIWEVVVNDGRYGIQSWEKAMPLAVVSIDPDLSSSNEADIPPISSSTGWFPRLPYFSSSLPQSVPQPITTHDHLQVSLIIAMPTPSLSQRPLSIQASSSTHANEQVTPQPNEEDDEDKGAPEIAFGVIVLPSEKGSLRELKDEISDD